MPDQLSAPTDGSEAASPNVDTAPWIRVDGVLYLPDGVLASVIRKLVNNETAVLNHGGYIVVNDTADACWGGSGSRCIDLTPDEFAVVKEVLGE